MLDFSMILFYGIFYAKINRSCKENKHKKGFVMKFDTRHDLKFPLVILAISAFFLFSFASMPEASIRTINVTTNLGEATFIINGPESHSGSGTIWSVAVVI